jgi:flagellar L-ring protein precursor FlgH
MGVLLLAAACANNGVSKEMPPHYIYKETKIERPTPGSLWRETSGLFEDRKARAINDLVTIKIVESTQASNKAETGTSRESSTDNKITDFFGLPLKIPLGNAFGAGMAGANFTPTIAGQGSNKFEGTGSTTREGSFIATITARVIDVLPNGNFVIESRKDIKLNREKEVLILRGVIRPDDIASDNTINSGYIANAELIYTGDGVISEKQRQPWLAQFMDWIWPF